jgi:biopolymer transport protein ExbB
MLQAILDLFRGREPIPFVMLAILCVGWVIIFERFVLLQFVYRVNFTKFDWNIRKMLAAGDMERARTYCAATSKTGLPLIAAKAIDAYQTDTLKVRMTVSEETMAFMPRIRRRISQIPNLATVVVLLGALAAVHGIWESFRMSDVLEQSVKSVAFTGALANALTPLGFALGAAILLMLPYGILDAVAARLEGDVEHSLTMILNVLAPETQAVFAAQPAVGAPAFINTEASGSRPSASSESAMSSNSAAPVAKEEEHVEAANDKFPDEEEII